MLSEVLNTIVGLEEQLVEGNETLIRLLSKLTPEQQKEYAPKVQEMIASTQRTIKEVRSELYS